MNDVQKPDNRILDTIIHGDCLALLKTLPSNSVDAIVTDPPSSIHFMGKSWDSNKGGRTQWIAWLAEIMQEALRCLKPGGHAFVWSLPRTSHYTAMALEDAGFEIRDNLAHLFGSGFPKSMDISKAIDKLFRTEREVVGTRTNGNRGGGANTYDDDNFVWPKEFPVTAPATDAAKQWSGYGTALKPSHETWWLARKPLAEPTIAENVLVHGTGGLNIDISRVGSQAYSQEQWNKKEQARTTGNTYGVHKPSLTEVPQGRFPSNTLFSHSPLCLPLGTKRVQVNDKAHIRHSHAGKQGYHGNVNDFEGHGYADPDGMEEVQAYECDPSCPVRLLDEQSGIRKTGDVGAYIRKGGNRIYGLGLAGEGQINTALHKGDEGGASRYFQTFAPDTEDIPPFLYQSKPSRKERNAGCETLPEKTPWTSFDGQYAKGRNPITGERTEQEYKREQSNHHPTVKSLALMRYLITMITPPHGIVLDCFAGSGSTLVACTELGMNFIGIEQDAEYVAIAEARIAHARQHGPITPLPLWEVVGHEREKIQSKEGA